MVKVAILGAGLVGLNIGGNLMKKGHRVIFLGRPRLQEQLQRDGLTISGLDWRATKFEPSDISYETDAPHVFREHKDLDYVLVTLKAVNNDDAIASLKSLPTHTIIVSFQNGVDNAAVLRRGLPDHVVVAGMFPYNVAELPGSHFHQASGGTIMMERRPEVDRLYVAMRESGLAIGTHPDMVGVLFGKLLVNLNNAVAALSGKKTREELSTEGYRQVFAAAIAEGLHVYEAAGIRPVAPFPLPMGIFPFLLRLPNWIFLRALSPVVAVDKDASGSMSQDLLHGRLTEVDHLNGLIVGLGAEHGVPTPVNARLVELVHRAEADKPTIPHIPADELMRLCGLTPSSSFAVLAAMILGAVVLGAAGVAACRLLM